MAAEKDWFALELTIEPLAAEAVQFALMQAGSLGTELREDSDATADVIAYFRQVPDRENVRRELADALRIYNLPSSSVRNTNLREVPDEDWLAEWKKSWQPVVVGDRFIIAPPWSEVNEQDRIVIRIEPGMAFGTGTHETTRLCLKAIEKNFHGGSFLDVGTGTGILAIAAALLYPESRVEACDVDADAVRIAQDNAQQNGVGNRIAFRVGSINEASASADCVCANLTATEIINNVDQLLAVTCGRLILSGILQAHFDAVLGTLNSRGVQNLMKITYEGEWACVVI